MNKKINRFRVRTRGRMQIMRVFQPLNSVELLILDPLRTMQVINEWPKSTITFKKFIWKIKHSAVEDSQVWPHLTTQVDLTLLETSRVLHLTNITLLETHKVYLTVKTQPNLSKAQASTKIAWVGAAVVTRICYENLQMIQTGLSPKIEKMQTRVQFQKTTNNLSIFIIPI